jgi:DNA helicase HerA-like ATPase
MTYALPTARLSPAQLLAHIERQQLDVLPLPPQPIHGLIDGHVWRRVRSLGRFWKAEEHGAVARAIGDMLIGLHGSGTTPVILIHTFSGELAVYVGAQPALIDTVVTIIRGCLPGITEQIAPAGLGATLHAQGAFAYGGQVIGVPTLKSSLLEEDGRGTLPPPPTDQIERLVRGMGRARWGYFVRAAPVGPGDVLRWAGEMLELLRHYDQQAGMSRQARDGLTVQGDRAARRCVEALELLLARFELGKAVGMWEAEAHFFAAETHTAGQAAGLLRAAFAGASSRPEPLRVKLCRPDAPPVGQDLRRTILHSGELSALMQLPTREAPGYEVHDYAPFDLALPESTQQDTCPVVIGEILDGETGTGQHYSIPRSHLTRHGLVVGVTGSGKTNTCFRLLIHTWDNGQGAPFLVIEPAKSEYRGLRAQVPDLRVYTLGDERCAPLRLNPFEFECRDAEHRVHVQTHIDYLKSVFGAAFVLYAPMPYVLETCLHEIYEDRGWNLTTGAVERRLPSKERGTEAAYPVFPTLHDLYLKIDPVVDRLGYDERISRDVKAGLKARIGSLLLGGKGLMLNTRSSVPIGELLRHPTVLELERIGDDDQKAFVIGMLLARIYEYRVVEGRRHEHAAEELRHLLLVEEAHRLLQHVSTAQDTESANPRGKAVETFTNMLAEIRAYGQGVLIAEQIPSKLAPDAIKNTNLKVLHRMVAADERRVMGGAMNLDEGQERAVTSLAIGRGVIYAEGADRPYLVRVDRTKGPDLARPSDATVRGKMVRLGAFDERTYRPRPGCEYCGLWLHDPRRCASVRDLAVTVQEQSNAREVYRRYLRACAEAPAQAISGYAQVVQTIRQSANPADDRELRDVTLCSLIHAACEQVDALGTASAIPYPALRSLHEALLQTAATVATGFRNDRDVLEQLQREAHPHASSYGDMLRAATARPVGPYAGCLFCRSRCHYGADVAPLARDPLLQRDVLRTIDQIADDDMIWVRLRAICDEAAERAIGQRSPAATICFAAQVGEALGFGRETQRKLVKNISDAVSAKHPGGTS